MPLTRTHRNNSRSRSTPYIVKGRGRTFTKDLFGTLSYISGHGGRFLWKTTVPAGAGEESIRGTDSARTVIQDCAFNRTRMLVWNFPGRERALRDMARACIRRQMSPVSQQKILLLQADSVLAVSTLEFRFSEPREEKQQWKRRNTNASGLSLWLRS